MSILTLEQLAETSGPLLGVDPGSKTFGIAVSDDTRLIASPVETIKRKKFTKDAERIFDIYDAKDCAAMVIGYPVNMDGSEGPRCQSVRQFADNLMNRISIDIAFWDERLSTVAVTRTMVEADLSRAKQKRAVDKMAAAYILQGALDYLRNQSSC